MTRRDQPIQLWAVSHHKWGIHNWTVRRTRREAIESFCELWGLADYRAWDRERASGRHQAIKVWMATRWFLTRARGWTARV